MELRGVVRVAAPIAGVLVVLLTAAAGGATDGFTTASVKTVAVNAGGTATASQTVHLEALPPKGDVLIALDATGSMLSALTSAKAEATAIVNALQSDFAATPGGSAKFAVAQFQDYPGSVFDTNTSDQAYVLKTDGLTADAAAVQSAIDGIALGDGGDLPEAYFRTFWEATQLGWETGAQRFLVVLGDQTGHDPNQQATFADCHDTSGSPVDPGTAVSGPLSAATAIADLKSANIKLSFIHYATSDFAVPLACHSELAAATGGTAVESSSTSTLTAQIESVVQAAARHITALSATVTTSPGGSAPDATANPASWVTVSGLPGSLDLPAGGGDVPFTLTVAPPAGAVPGTYKVDVNVVADTIVRATEQVTIAVDPISGLAVSATPASVGAGIDQVKLTDVPNAWLSYYAGSTLSSPVGSTPVGSTPVGSTPVGSTPVGSTPVGSTPVGSTPVGSTPVGSTPVGSTGLFDMPVGSTPVGSTALSSILLSQIGLSGTSWDQLLCGSLQNQPLSALTLGDLQTNGDRCADGKTSLDHFEALPLKQVDLSTTLLKSVRWATLLMANTPLSALPGGFGAWCGAGGLIPENGGSCDGASDLTTVLQMDVAGRLGSAPVGSTPVGSTPVGSTPVGSTPVGSTDVAASRLALIPLSTIDPIAPVVDCSAFDCSKTLGDAYAAGKILPGATFADIASAMAAANITINDLVVAVIGAAGFPWEQLPVQGLQPYAHTPSKVAYRVGATVDCSVLTSFSISTRLPDGFFPDGTTAKLSLDGGTSFTSLGAPTVVGDGPADAAKRNTYRWDLGCGTATASVSAVLTFDAFVGLRLGTFTTTATARAGAFAVSSTGGSVAVGQNGEPGNDDPAAAPVIAPDTLVVGHVGASGDQDFYRVSLDGLPRGTRIGVFLSVPQGTDFDLSVSKPQSPSFFSTPVGSTPVGSTPIEDTGVGFATTGQALPSETLQDIPVGSTPVGSTPVGSTPVGSTSTTRGDANEAAQIVTNGESGYATIDVTGYNGATSDRPYVLRVKRTPPPPLPGSCPARQLSLSSSAQGTLPSSLPTTTKSLFIVNKQRLTAMYGSSAVTSLLNALNTLAARSEVSGSVLAVDGSAAVRNAYAAWDTNPCDVAAANAVVRSINDVVASYRNSTDGLPNLHYIVLVGSDEATPMARTPDPVTLSPELNEASDLAFTTSNLANGNALYDSAAQNYLLTDGAYGAFTSIPWLGHDLLLPQLSVSRLVETPADVLGQVNRYLGNNGVSAPQTGIGTLSPTSAVVTGYDFLADGADGVAAGLHANFGLTAPSTLGSGSAITHPGTTDVPWSAADLLSSFLAAASPAGIGSVNGHYNHYELQAADHSLATTGQVSASLPARILFTMGCHGGLNVADTLGGSGGKYLDWPQLYATKQAAVYIANTGFGYGDSDSVALSERLLSLFAKNLHSDAGSVGEEWAATLQQYFATAGAYDVYDEKVMEETTFYGLPFWHFGTAGAGSSFTPLTTTVDPVTGTPSATVSFGSSDGLAQTQFGLYRPLLPIRSKEVTSTSLPARGLWITSLATQDTVVGADPGYPTIDLAAHEPKPHIGAIFFPASPFTLEHARLFGKQRDYANISDQYRPVTGTQRHVTGATLEVFYSNSVDAVPPLISEVHVTYDGGAGTAGIQARITDDSGTVKEVAALVDDGSWRYVQLAQSAADPTLWTASTPAAADPEVFVEATDGQNVAYSANKGANFTSTTSGGGSAQILMQAPTGPYALNQQVNATYQCAAGAVPVAQCVGSVPSGQPIDTSTFGSHTFVVKALDADGNVLASLQRAYDVSYLFKGFFAPVDNPPALNVVKAGSGVPVKFSLTGYQGMSIFFDATYPRSETVACDASAPADALESTVSAGSSSLSYDAVNDQYVYAWKTDSSWSGTCRALIVKTKDGVTHRADFKFR